MLGFHEYSKYECHFYYDGPLIISFMTDQGLSYLAKISSDPFTDEEWEYFAIEATKEEIDQYFEDTKCGKPLDEVSAGDKKFFGRMGYTIRLSENNMVEFKEYKMGAKGEVYV